MAWIVDLSGDDASGHYFGPFDAEESAEAFGERLDVLGALIGSKISWGVCELHSPQVFGGVPVPKETA
jgi:hypothetical protein